MKKLFALCIALVMCLTAVAEMPGMVGVSNPITEYETLEEINELVGCSLCRPGVMGLTDERFSTISCGDYTIAQYDFAINGYAYTFRSAAVTEDISGVYINAEPAFPEFTGDIQFVSGEGLHLARWFDINGQYCLCVEDPNGEIDEETFKLIAEELCEMTNPALSEDEVNAYFASLAGSYTDSFSERATLELTANGDGSAYIMIHWANSAVEYVQWTMNVTLGEDGLWYYTDCAKAIGTTADSGSESFEVIYENGCGFFGEYEGVISWNGAEEDSCVDCTFVK